MAAMLDQQPHLLTRVISAPATSTVHQVLLFAVVVALFSRICHFVYNDYHAFLALGPGGTPSTFSGYVRVSWVRVLAVLVCSFIQKCLVTQSLPGSGLADTEIIFSFAFLLSRILLFRPQFGRMFCRLLDISFGYLVALAPDPRWMESLHNGRLTRNRLFTCTRL